MPLSTTPVVIVGVELIILTAPCARARHWKRPGDNTRVAHSLCALTLVQQALDVIEDIRKGGQLFAVLEQLRQIVGDALRRLLAALLAAAARAARAAVVIVVVVVRLACGGGGGGAHLLAVPEVLLLLELLVLVLLVLLLLVVLGLGRCDCCCSSRKVGEINGGAGAGNGVAGTPRAFVLMLVLCWWWRWWRSVAVGFVGWIYGYDG